MNHVPTPEEIQAAKTKAKASTYPGWSCLLDEFFDRFPQVAQGGGLLVWDKWGSLRCKLPREVLGQLPGLADFIDEMETRSESLCEVCGGPAKPRGTGWVHTLCDSHFHDLLKASEPPRLFFSAITPR